ncbi:hypothetical protein GN156_37050, partial [bacterium LRH843]|nr:hypothetical protein [bacterium LRH843]
RHLKAQLDEVRVVREILGAGPGLMLDVGAHTGGSLHWFKADAWTIHAFEPDPANRARLEKAAAGFGNVAIHPVAVSDTLA